jgi:hypothetical protein
MSKIVGDIAIKVGADTTSLTTGMRGAEASLAKFAKVGAGAVAAVGVAMVALTKQSLANIDVLAKQARSLGLTTQAFQKMSLVAGEAGIQSGNLSAMLGLMQRNLDELRQGTKTQTDAFGQLGLSIRDLQGLAPDEQFQKIAESLTQIGDPAQKTALAMQVFGRAGRDAINMLSGYGEAAANAAEFQNRFGIAVTQTASDGVERANDAVGRLGMVMQGLGNTMATAVAPALERTANGLIEFASNIIGAKVTLDEFFGTLEMAKATLGEDVFNDLIGDPAKIRENAPAIEQVSAAVLAMSSGAEEAIRVLNRLRESLIVTGERDGAASIQAVIDAMELANQKFKAGKISADEFGVAISDAKTKADNLISALDSVAQAQFSGLIGRLGGLWGALDKVYQKALDARNALPTDPTELMRSPSGVKWDGWQADPNAPKTRPNRPGVDSFGDLLGDGEKGGSGGGIKGQFDARLEALIAGLQTEREVIDEWYATSLESLNMATESELAALGGKHEAMERLEQEHQDRLGQIREMGNQWGVAAALDGFGSYVHISGRGERVGKRHIWLCICGGGYR